MNDDLAKQVESLKVSSKAQQGQIETLAAAALSSLDRIEALGEVDSQPRDHKQTRKRVRIEALEDVVSGIKNQQPPRKRVCVPLDSAVGFL